MAISVDEATAIAKHALSADQLERSAIYLLRPTIHFGPYVVQGPQSIAIHQPSYLLFVDLSPGTNWIHPGRYLVIAEANGNTETLVAQYPPTKGTTELLFHGSSVEPWMLLS